MNETVIVHENGRRKTITKMEAMTKQLVNKAASGEPRATQLLLQMIQLYEDRPDAPAQTEAVDDTVRCSMNSALRRISSSGSRAADCRETEMTCLREIVGSPGDQTIEYKVEPQPAEQHPPERAKAEEAEDIRPARLPRRQ